MDVPGTPAERQLHVAQRHRQDWAVIEVTGPLRWPHASQLTEVVPPAASLGQSSILLDLTGVTAIDNTGIAVLASVAAQLKRPGRTVRVIVADEQLRRRLPRTVGLQKIFPSIDDAVRSAAGTDSLSQDSGDTLGVRRLVSDVARLSDDLAELGPPDPHHRPGPVPEELEEIPDVEYDASMWTDAEHEGFGAPDRHAP